MRYRPKICRVKKGGYGYQPDDPIILRSVPAIYEYIRRLRWPSEWKGENDIACEDVECVGSLCVKDL